MNTAPHGEPQPLSVSEERLRLALDAADICIWDWNIQENRVTFSDNFSKLFKIEPEIFKGKYRNMLKFIHPNDRKRVDRALRDAIELNQSYDEEFRIAWPDNQIRWMRIRGHVHNDKEGVPLRLLGSIHDKTERRMAQDTLRKDHTLLEKRVKERTRELSDTNRKLRSEIAERKKLQKELMEISEKEQQRIGQDLHDHILQQIGGIIFMSQALHDRLLQENVSRAEDMARIIQHLNLSLKHARGLSRGLYPIIEQSGLKVALEDLAISMQELFRITIHLDYDGKISRIHNPTAIHIFRIIQEALNNAIKHGHAGNLHISLKKKLDEIHLTIMDDGKGFPQKPNRRGMGLNIMRYRASIIGASFSLETDKNSGTTIVCKLKTSHIQPPNHDRESGGIK